MYTYTALTRFLWGKIRHSFRWKGRDKCPKQKGQRVELGHWDQKPQEGFHCGGLLHVSAGSWGVTREYTYYISQ